MGENAGLCMQAFLTLLVEDNFCLNIFGSEFVFADAPVSLSFSLIAITFYLKLIWVHSAEGTLKDTKLSEFKLVPRHVRPWLRRQGWQRCCVLFKPRFPEEGISDLPPACGEVLALPQVLLAECVFCKSVKSKEGMLF